MGTDRMTLMDISSMSDPDGAIARIVEVLSRKVPELNDAPAYPSNSELGHRITIRSSLPATEWRRINKGVTRSKGSTRQVIDGYGWLTALSEVDAGIARIVGEGKLNAARWKEDKGFLMSMGQTFGTTLWYGNVNADPAAFTGFQPRLETLATAITGSQVRAHHSSPAGSDYTSIYVIDWGEDACHLVYPMKGSPGISAEDQGKQRVTDDASKPFMALVTEYNWNVGLAVEDPRHVGRLCNIDVSQALNDSTFANLLATSLVKMLAAMPGPEGNQRVLYTTRNIVAALQLQVQQQSNVLFKFAEYLGAQTLHFQGHPIKASDQITEAESLVT